MDDRHALIRKVLGAKATPFDYEVDGVERTGWKTYVLRERSSRNPSHADAIVARHWRACHELDVRLFVGPSLFRIADDDYVDMLDGEEYPDPSAPGFPDAYYQILALPEFPVPDIVQFVRTGAHNAADPEAQCQSVRQGMIEAMEIAPFEILGADRASLDATFLAPVSPRHAKAIAKIIFRVNIEAVGLVEHALPALGLPMPKDRKFPDWPDYDAAMALYLVHTGRFKLWWD